MNLDTFYEMGLVSITYLQATTGGLLGSEHYLAKQCTSYIHIHLCIFV
jgi:hypothetical protein